MAGAGDGIPVVTQAIVNLGIAAQHTADDLNAAAKAENDYHTAAAASRGIAGDLEQKRRDAYGPDWESADDASRKEREAYNAGLGQKLGTEEYQGNEGLNPLSEQVLDEEGFAAGSYTAANKATAAYDAKIASDLENFGKELDQAYGEQTAIGFGFEKLAEYIRAGRFSGQVAEQYAQAIFFNWTAGAAQDLADPTKSNAVKALVAEFLRFESSGQLQ